MNTYYIIAHNKTFDYIVCFYSNENTKNYINLLETFNIKENKDDWEIVERFYCNKLATDININDIISTINNSFVHFNDYETVNSNTIKINCSIDSSNSFYIFIDHKYYKDLRNNLNDKQFQDFYEYIDDTNSIKIKQIAFKDNEFIYLDNYNTISKRCEFNIINHFRLICPTTINPEIFIKLNKFERQLVHFIFFLQISNNFDIRIKNITEVQNKIKNIKEDINAKISID